MCNSRPKMLLLCKRFFTCVCVHVCVYMCVCRLVQSVKHPHYSVMQHSCFLSMYLSNYSYKSSIAHNMGITAVVQHNRQEYLSHCCIVLHSSFHYMHMKSQSDQYDCRSHHSHMGLHHRGRPLEKSKN